MNTPKEISINETSVCQKISRSFIAVMNIRVMHLKGFFIIGILFFIQQYSFAQSNNAFSYRGVLLDESRHFFGKEVVHKLIDTLQAYNMNYLHWHLTDDHGWRIQIKKYSLLTKVGAWRTEIDGSQYGGFYTQDDIREIVAYAASKGITIVPEIDMPGHSTAAIAAYPFLGSGSQSIQIPTRSGIYHNILSPTDTVIAFLKDVYDEVIGLFPGPYIHIGGDEVPKKSWKQADFYPELLRKYGLKNAEELQSHFMQQIESYINSKGRRCMVWGEVVKGGLSQDMIVMSWRGKGAGIKAARLGNIVIMTPRQYCYFDYPMTRKGKKPSWWMPILPEKKVAQFEPYSKQLNAEENKLIIGAQVALWTEKIDSEEKLWHQLMSRLRVFSAVMSE